MMNKHLFSSEKKDWETPQWLFDKLNEEFDFKLDPCATRENRKCEDYFFKEIDGLSRDWSYAGSVFMNPPYGREIKEWVEKAHRESQKGCIVVGLLPVRTDTKWFHNFVYHKAEIRFLDRRLKFSGSKNNATFPSMVVIWRCKTLKGEI